MAEKQLDQGVQCLLQNRLFRPHCQILGLFEQNNRCFVVLEYAKEGSLLELFRRDPPATAEQRRYFLYGMMGLTKAIDKIQNLGGGPNIQRTGLYVIDSDIHSSC